MPLIKNGYANGLVIKEFVESELQNKKVYEIPVECQLLDIDIGVLYNINNEELVNSLFLNLF